MINNFFIWLLEASVSILFMTLTYKLLFDRLTFFVWNRTYLIAGLILCLILPLLPIPSFFQYFFSEQTTFQQVFYPQMQSFQLEKGGAFVAKKSIDLNWFVWLTMVASGLYLIGVIYKTILLINSLRSLARLKKESFLVKVEDFCSIFLQNTLPTFSFGSHIFLNENTTSLDETETELVLLHEKTHIRQKHSFDMVFYEIMSIVFWFHPCMYYLSKSLSQVHEYLVDRHVTSQSNTINAYGQLLVKLATQQRSHQFVHTFSDSRILERIKMLTKPKSNSMEKLKFLSVLPLLAAVVLLCSCFGEQKPNHDSISAIVTTNQKPTVINKLTWIGNEKHSTEELNQILGLKAGDLYDSIQLDNRLYNYNAGKDIASLYMDDGYLFFHLETKKNIRNNKADITLTVSEGQQAKIGKVIIIGNRKVPAEKIYNLIEIKPGDSFNRSKLIASQRKLSESGLFDPKHININPTPDPHSFETDKVGTVDMEFVVTEL